MDPAPPPLPRDHFRLPGLAWIIWAVFAAVRVALFLRTPNPTPNQWGEVTGEVLGMLLFPALIAWLVWKFADRSRTVTTVTFAAVIALGVIGRIVPLAFERGNQVKRRVEASQRIEKIAEESKAFREKQRAVLAQGGNLDDKGAENLAKRTSEQMAEVAKNSTGEDRLTAEAAQAYMDGLLAVKARYDQAAAEMKPDEIWTLTGLDSPESIEARRAIVRQFSKANAELVRFQNREFTALRQEMEQRKVRAAIIDAAVQAAKARAGKRVPFIAKIRELDEDFAQLIFAYLDLAEKNLGQIERNGDQVTFKDPALQQRQRELLQRVEKIGEEQRDCQKQMFAAER